MRLMDIRAILIKLATNNASQIMFDKNQRIKKRQHMTWIKGKPYQSHKKVLLIMF